jgi:poly(3-hydroxybutyrate) depolymerase
MALRMACVDTGTFAAIGLLVSTMWDVAGADCRPARPVPLLAVSGTTDVALPYAGSLSARGDGIWPVERLVGFFRRHNGCIAEAVQAVLPGMQPLRIEVEQSSQCAGAPVVLYRMVGQGHDVPPALNAGKLLLDFFRDKSR